MNKGMKTLIGILGIAGIVLMLFGCINLYAASVQEKMTMAAVALSVVILLGLILLIRQARRQNLEGKQAVVLIGLGCLVPEIVSLVCE